MDVIPENVAIIGAGLSGCALALCLQAHSIPVQIYESRSSTAPELASGVILTPNGLRILQRLGVFDRIKDVCWIAEYRTYKDDQDRTTRKVKIAGEEVYGFANHRLWRRVLLEEMKSLLMERGDVEIFYRTRFKGLVSDDEENGVRFRVSDEGDAGDGHEVRAAILVGADGIFSSVRKYIDPDVVPDYTGVMGIIAHINRSTVQWPSEDFEKQCTIQGKPGALVLMPEVKDGSEIMVAMQSKYPDQSRSEWDALAKDKSFMVDFFRRDYDQWHETGKKIIDAITAHPESLYLWPYMKIPKMKHMYSPLTGRVILVGDSAHALPPSSGQGANQAFEDVWSLTQLLISGRNRLQALKFWQDLRQKRIEAVYQWTMNATNVQRMPEEDRLRIIKERQITESNVVQSFDDMDWLYRPNSDAEIEAWIERN